MMSFRAFEWNDLIALIHHAGPLNETLWAMRQLRAVVNTAVRLVWADPSIHATIADLRYGGR